MTKLSAIYQISCTANSRVYIGSSVNVCSRINEHRAMLRKHKHHNPALQASWDKYGESNFEFKIVRLLAIGDDLREIERSLIIKAGNSAFNATAETRTPFDDPKIREKSQITRNKSPTWRLNTAEGRRNSPIFLDAVRKSGRDNAHHLRRPEVQQARVAALRASEKHKLAMPDRIEKLARPWVRELAIEGMNKSPIVQAIRAKAAERRAKIASDKDERNRRRQLIGTNIKTGEVRLFVSVAAACRELNIQQANISRVARADGRRKMAGGWTWEFAMSRHGK